MGMFKIFLIFEAENQRSREAEKLGKSRSREAEEADLAHGPSWISHMRASCMIITTYSPLRIRHQVYWK